MLAATRCFPCLLTQGVEATSIASARWYAQRRLSSLRLLLCPCRYARRTGFPPNNDFHNTTYAGNFGADAPHANDLRFTVRHLCGLLPNDLNAVLLYGIPDDASAKEHDDYYSAAWNNQDHAENGTTRYPRRLAS